MESSGERIGAALLPPAQGEVAALVRCFDWAATPLGPVSAWPRELLNIVGVILRSPVGMVVLWGEEGTMIYNDGYARFAGDRHPQHLGMAVRDSWPEARDFNDNVMNTVMAGGVLSYKDQELVLNRKGAPERLWLDLDYSPVPGPDGRPGGVLAVVVETTEKVLARRHTMAQTLRLQKMFEQAPGFIALLNGPDHVFELANEAYMRLVGQRDLIGRRVEEVLPELREQKFIDLLDQVYTSGDAFAGRAVQVHLRSEQEGAGHDRHVDFVFQPVKDDIDRTVGIFVEGSDVTERVLAEAQREIMMDEMSHRLKNALAVVQAVAAQTLRAARSLPEAREMLDARIIALSRAQELLRKEQWHRAEMAEVARVATEAVAGPCQGIVLSGPELELSAGTAVALSLALHELATNSAKYGALSAVGGRVDLGWRTDDGQFSLCWQERGGPPVEPPARRGFGTHLIERIIAMELGAKVVLDYNPSGFHCSMTTPVDRVAPGREISPVSAGTGGAPFRAAATR